MGLHVYTNSAGKQLPSVTHIIDVTRPMSERIKMGKAMEKKREKLGLDKEGWEQYRDDAANRGTMCHNFLEKSLKTLESIRGLGDKEKVKEAMKRVELSSAFWEGHAVVGDYIKQINCFIKELQTEYKDWSVISAENVVINEELGYGGRADLFLRVEDSNILLDLKTNGGYYSEWKQCHVYHWNEWRKPKSEPVMVEKIYKNGSVRMVQKRDSEGKLMKIKEELPKVEERGWDWVNPMLKDKYLQLALYILGVRDMELRNEWEHKVNAAALLVVFPGNFQLIRLPASAWAECKAEAVRRVELFYKEHYEKWALEALVSEPVVA